MGYNLGNYPANLKQEHTRNARPSDYPITKLLGQPTLRDVLDAL